MADWDELRSSMRTSDQSIAADWNRIIDEGMSAESRWIAGLRAMDIKASHPDDGHVDRTKHERFDFVRFCYPQFDDQPGAGDMIALGSPDRYRVRKVLEVIPGNWLLKQPVFKIVK